MLSPLQLGLAGGTLWGLCMFISTAISIYTGFAEPFLNIMASIYLGYTISWGGSFLGLIYGFLDLFIGLSLLALLYNLFTRKA